MVCPTPPFQKVSVDLVGHFLVKPTMTSRIQSKIWVLMYLCDVSKAIHTEVIDSMSSSSIINAFRSCFAIRNTPEQISSDPGKGFVGAKNKLEKRNRTNCRGLSQLLAFYKLGSTSYRGSMEK